MSSVTAPNSILPRHIAIVLDGNGRWAKQRGLPRLAGHRAGVKTVRRIVQTCAEKNIEALTLFAFSSENWGRPAEEVSHLMRLFLTALQKEIEELAKNNIQIQFIGNKNNFNPELLTWMQKAIDLTAQNTGLKLILAVDYGGRWDITHACQLLSKQVALGHLKPEDISSDLIDKTLSTASLPEPDLFIRTSGEQRISNFLLWQLAYTELYFTQKYWPDFDEIELEAALTAFAKRGRRFGGVMDVTSHA